MNTLAPAEKRSRTRRLLEIALSSFVVAACSSSHGGSGSQTANGGAAGDASTVTGGASGQAGTTGGDASEQGGAGTAGAGAGGQGGALDQAGDTGDAGDPGGADAGGGSSGAGGASPNEAPICPPGPYAATPLPDDLSLTTVCTGMHTSEGAVWFGDLGVLFFSNFDSGDVAGNYNGNIVRYTPGAGCEPFIQDVGTNGLAIAPDGQLVAVSHKTQEVLEFNLTTKQATSLASSYMGKHFGSPNDIAVHKSGSIYFTDPAAEKGNRPQELPTAVYRIDPAGVLSEVDEFDRANGINFSPDQTRLYVSNYDVEVRVYDVSPDGVATNGAHFLDVGSDGMTVDCAGNIYTTAGEVRVWSPQGQLLGTIHGTGTATNVAFGGPDRKTLFITSFAGDLKTVALNIPGFPY